MSRKSVMLELFRESIIIQSTITLLAIGIAGYMLVAGRLHEVPPEWWGLVALVVGYWFGSKGTFQANQAAARAMEALERTVLTRHE